ncbi:MAG TPA: hypothetical protein DCX25_03920 [Candidatus Pacebacteria bacterium]|nr:MAG: hypothetical protein UX00_C0005G0042 [Microgenomates group bacterium GW2011_GWB1_45_17]KKU24807.1 MAG: hypothetical protein UX36_C0001G0424 [Microgenomates group bacterium GW2011_GWC1_46_15]HAV15453.1 hypothetical protein [Candidatus Paceibacterota bacterium]HCR11488.1 hypothetical protein [Candidatus Paceibacterota bacterium]HCR92963.1 hypothetical protein [Candidatus Paceibacterota bacterium]
MKNILQKYHSNKFSIIIAVILLALFFAFSFYGYLRVGLEYDEILTANAALGCPHPDIFLSYAVHIGNRCIPIMLSPYIGAPMAFIPRVIFTFLMPSVQAIRMANILFVGTSLCILAISIWKIFGKKIALYTLFFLVFDAQFLLTQRLDRTSVFPFFLKAIFLLFLFHVLYTKRKIGKIIFFLLGFFAGLNIYTKLDAVFWIGSIALALFIQHIYLHHFSKLIHGINLRNTISVLAGMFVAVSPLLYYVRSAWINVFATAQKLQGFTLAAYIEKLHGFFFQLQIPETFSYVFEIVPTFPKMISVLAVFCILLWFLSAYKTIKQSKHVWIGISFFIFFIVYMSYKGLIFSYHRLLIYPIPQLALALFCSHLKRRSILYGIFAMYLIIFLSTYISFDSLGKTTCGRGSFTCAIYPLYERVRHENVPIVVGDWGIATQLLFLSNGKLDIHEVAFVTNQQNDPLIEQILSPLTKVCAPIILRPTSLAKFSLADSNLRKILSNVPQYTQTDITDLFGNTQFEVFSCR